MTAPAQSVRRSTFRPNIDRRKLPVLLTIGLFVLGYALAALRYPLIGTAQVFNTLLITDAFMIITAVGMTFVIISGGIDLSVAAVIAFTTTASAAMLEKLALSPIIVIPTVLLLGMALGAGMGALIQYFKIPPFVATLAGMFLARGACYIISLDPIRITDPFYDTVAKTQIMLPGGSYTMIHVIIALIMVALGTFILGWTQFGRTVYAIGGNEQSAILMGLPVARTRVLIYTLSGFCSALAGVVYSITAQSGHGGYAMGFELDAIASVVIGGTPLSGGAGYVIGTFFGVLIRGLIQQVISFDGTLSTWLTPIIIGLLTLFFIGMQRLLTAKSEKRR